MDTINGSFNRSKNRDAYSIQVCKVLCANFATFLIVIIDLSTKADWSAKAVLLTVGIIVDFGRRRFAPELQLSIEERKSKIEDSLKNSAHRKLFNRRFFLLTASIYWVWWAYFFLAVLPFYMFSHNDLTSGRLQTAIDYFPSKFYPFLRNNEIFSESFGQKTYANIATEYLSVTWDIMFLAAISEISSGAFYYIPKDIEYVRIQNPRRKWKITRGTTHLVLVCFCGLILYSFPFLASGLSGSNGNPIGQEVSSNSNIFGAIFVAFLGGISVLGTAGAVRYLYLNVLYRISGTFETLVSK